jgi:iron(III) transport system substrate-binding protein
MKHPGISRRTVLKGSGALLAGAAFSTRVMASAPPPEPVTPALVEAAKKEGQVSYYTSTDLPVAEKLAKAFEAKYPDIAVRVERTGAERVFQRIGQEYSSNTPTIRPSTRTSTASSPVSASGSASSPTTPIW